MRTVGAFEASLVSFVVTVVGVLLLSSLVPGFEDQTAFVVLPLFISLYSVGRYARQLEAMWFPPNRGGVPYAASRSGAAVFS